MTDVKVRSGRVNDFQRGAISTLRTQGVTIARIAEVLGLHESTVAKQIKWISDSGKDPFALSLDIIKNTLPLAALKQAQAVMSEDTERADQASYRMLKGGGAYRDHVDQTTRAIPDSEIVAGMTELFIDALMADAQDAEYTVSDSNPTALDDRSTTISTPGDILHGSETATKEPRNGAETVAAAPPMNTDDRVKQVRNSGETMGKLVARTNAKRWTANVPTESNTGATHAEPDAQDERP